MRKFRLAILGSTRGTAMQSIIDAITSQKLHASIELVLSNKNNAFILDRGKQHGLNAQWIDDKNQGQWLFEQQLAALLHRHHVDLLVLVGYMRILTPSFVRKWFNKIINVHPSLLPLFSGLRDLEVHQAVLDKQHQTTGCSVHYVIEEVDCGEVIIQKQCLVGYNETVETLKEKVQYLEGAALVEAISLLQAQQQLKE